MVVQVLHCSIRPAGCGWEQCRNYRRLAPMSSRATMSGAYTATAPAARPNLSRFLCAMVSNVPTQDKALELLNGINYNYEIASYYERVLVS